MSETVAGVVNYFLRISKYNGSGSHSATFRYQRTSGEALADKYVYEFDFRWIEASDMMSNCQVILVKMGAGGSVVCPGSYIADPSGNFVSYGGVNMFTGEWHAMKYLFARNETNDGWNGTAFCDGKVMYTFTVMGNDVPYVNYETRWNLKEDGVTKYSNLTLDVDRLKISAITQKGHVFVEKAEYAYLISEANCLSPAVYGKTCEWCGEMSKTETFTVGEKGEHSLGNVVSDRFKVCDADCNSALTYYKSCKICNMTSEDTFSIGALLGHDDAKIIVSEATRTEAEVCYYKCSRCNRTTEPATNGYPLSYCFYEDKKLPSTVSISGFRSEPLTEGLWACVLSEEVNGAVNYYLNVQKKSNTQTHNLTFASTEEGGEKYVYEFDFRWNYADRMRGNGPIIVKMKLADDQKAASTIVASSDGKSITYSGSKTLNSGEWHTIRYEFAKTSDGWSFVVKVDGANVDSGSFKGTGIPKVVYETRYGETEQVDTDGDGVAETTKIKNCTDISFDIDNVYIKKD